MTTHIDTAIPEIVADIRFLVGRGRGPEATRARVCAWATTLETDADAAFEMKVLQQVSKDLVVLAHSNAAFSLAPAPDEWTEPRLEIDDRGGYLLAQLIIAAIRKAAPIGPQARAELASHTRSVTIGQMTQIAGYLQRI